MSTYTVNTTSDAVNPGSGLLTLRQAIAEADASSTPSSIGFSSTVFAPGSMHTITLAQGQLEVSGTTTIDGPSAGNLTIDANHTGRVFQISSGANVILQNMTITNGLVATAPGVAAMGGAILNFGSLQVIDDTVSNSNASGGSFIYNGNSNTEGVGGEADGGGIYSIGTLEIVGSIISGNTAQAGASYDNDPLSTPITNIAQGGGIDSGGPLTIQGSTITDNTISGGEGDGGAGGGASFGGGVYENGTSSFTSSTISNNTARGGNGQPTSGSQNSGANSSGGGIYLTGTSAISSVTFTGNIVDGGNSSGGGGSAGAASGGAIFSSGPVTMNSSTVNANFAIGGGGPFDDNGAGGPAYGAGIASTDALNLSSSTISNNVATGGTGQPDQSYPKAFACGGGIYSTGVLSVVSSTISGNTAQGDPSTAGGDTYGAAGGSGQGGGVYLSGNTTITNSTLSGNIARGGVGDPPYHGGTGGAGGAGQGGGVFNNYGTLTITNSTLANNSAEGGAGAAGDYNDGDGGNGGNATGGAIDSDGLLNLYDSTVSGNSASGGAAGPAGAESGNGYFAGSPGRASGAGITISGGYFFVDNSIISGNTDANSTEDDLLGFIVGNTNGSSGNLIGSGSNLVNGVNGNIVGVDNPMLQPLGNYGGPTETMPPLSTSPAFNAGVATYIPAGVTTDQRGEPRIAGSNVDIGAVEVQSYTVTGNVFNDLNGDGIQQTGEPGLANVTVYADLSNSGYFKAGDPTAITNSSGNYTISGVPEGTVIIRQQVPAGDRQSYPIGGDGEHVNVTAAGVKGALFADSTRLYISGTVTFNGVGQSGVLVYADLNNDGTFESNENNKTTGTGGSFAFVSLAAGTYTFRVVPPAGEVLSGNSAVTVTLGSGGVDTSVNFALAAQPFHQLTGTVIGTSGSYKNDGNTAAKAFDGNLSTYFDAPTASGSWAGLNLGSPQIITQISYAPRSGWASRMVGGMFQGSSSANFTSGVVTLYTVTSTPATGVLTTVPISNTTAFQYVRYIGPANSYCDIAEAEFFGQPAQAATLSANGVLSVTGTSGADNISINLTPTTDTVTVNGVTQTFAPSRVVSVDVTTLDGNDTISIYGNDSSGTQKLPTVSVQSGNGNDGFSENLNGDGSGNDPGAFVTIIAGNGNDSFSISGSSIDASVTAGNGSDTFITTISGTGNMHATISAGDGNDSMTASNSGGYGSEEIVFNAGIGVDTVLNTDEDDYVSGTLGGESYSLIPGDQELLGNVYQDQNGDGRYEAGEPLVPDAPVSFNNSTDGTFGTSTDSTGRYLLTVYYDPNVAPVTTNGWTSPITLSSQNGQGELISGVDFALAKPLPGTIIGTSGSYQNDGNTIAKAFDGNLNTFFDGPTANGNYAGRDLGTAQVITAIAYAPRAGWASRMVGGMFQGSNSPTFSSGVVTLYTVTSTPATGVLTTVPISNTTAFQYVRYIGPANGYCNIAEAQFFGNPLAVGATLEPDGTVVVNGTSGSDTITVQYDVNPVTSDTLIGLSVTVDGQTQTIDGSTFRALQINSFGGDDNISVTNNTYGELTDSTSVSFPVIINAGDGDDTISTLVEVGYIDDPLDTPAVSVTAGNGNDTITEESQTVNYSVVAGNGNDTISTLVDGGYSMNATLIAGNGDDQFSIGNEIEHVTLASGSGTDTVQVGDYADFVTGTMNGRSISASETQTIITGTVYADTNDNGTFDSVEPVVANFPVSFTFSGQTYATTSSGNGSYSLAIPTNQQGGSITGYGRTISVYDMVGGLLDNINIALPTPLPGTIIGTSGSYQNDGNTIAKALDGNLNTFFDGPTANGNYAGRDLGTAQVITAIAYAPRAGWASRMVGGIFQGSNSANFANAVNLYTVTATPATGVLTYIPLSNTAAYRYVRYLSPNGSYGDVAEVQFFGNPPPFASVSNGTLTVTGTEGADTISVDFNIDQEATGFTGSYSVEENGQTLTSDAATITSVVITSLDGNDNISVNGQQEYDVGSATPVSLVINSGNGNDTFNLYRDDGQPNLGGDDGSSVTLTAGNGNDSVSITGGTFANITLGNGNDSVTTAATSSRLSSTEILGNGNDSVIAGGAGNGGQLATVTAGSGEDSFLNTDTDDGLTVNGTAVADATCTLSGSVLSTLAGDHSGAVATVILTNVNNGVDGSYNSSQGVPIGSNYTFSGLPSPFEIGSGEAPTFTITVTPPAGYTVAQSSPETYQESANLTTGYNFLLTPTSVPLTGTVIGTPGSYRNHGTTIANAFDGNLSTYFDGPDASGDWVGLDLGAPTVVTQVEYAPRAGYEGRMVGGEIQASDSANFSSGVVTLYTISSKPTAGVLTTAVLNNSTAYRYYRYIGPANSYCDIAELELFA